MNSATRRTYNSTRRREQARRTRLHILEAARTFFTRRGYAGTTMEAVAREAGVAVETVYAVFGSKCALLSALVGLSLAGDDQPVPFFERPGRQEVLHEKDPRRQVQLFAADMTSIMQRVAPLFEVMHAAARTEPEIAGLLQGMLASRAENLLVFVRALQANGPLRPGLTVEEAGETVWALSSAEMFNLLVGGRGWTPEKFAAWLAGALARLILPDGTGEEPLHSP